MSKVTGTAFSFGVEILMMVGFFALASKLLTVTFHASQQVIIVAKQVTDVAAVGIVTGGAVRLPVGMRQLALLRLNICVTCKAQIGLWKGNQTGFRACMITVTPVAPFLQKGNVGDCPIVFGWHRVAFGGRACLAKFLVHRSRANGQRIGK